jgi:magnesium-transporting ATPase (P-type)
MGERVDAVAILAIVILTVVIGLAQEGKAERAIKSFRTMESSARGIKRERDPSSRPIGAQTLDREATRLLVV